MQPGASLARCRHVVKRPRTCHCTRPAVRRAQSRHHYSTAEASQSKREVEVEVEDEIEQAGSGTALDTPTSSANKSALNHLLSKHQALAKNARRLIKMHGQESGRLHQDALDKLPAIVESSSAVVGHIFNHLQANRAALARAPQPGRTRCNVTVKGVAHSLDPLLLRDSCTCSACVDPSSRQKQFSTADIPQSIEVADIQENVAADAFSLRWINDIPGWGPDHVTELSSRLLHLVMSNRPPFVPESLGKVTWDKERMLREVKVVDYSNYMTHDAWLFEVVSRIQRHGLVFLKNVPDDEESVIKIGNRVGPLKNTFYGLTWDVRSVPDAKNVAYTHQHLGFHMDLLYMQQPPRLQLLHCLQASTEGGASLFSDSYRAVGHLFKNNTAAFEALSQLNQTFHYDNDSQHYFQQRAVIQLAKDPEESTKNIVSSCLEAVNWSPPFQGPFQGSGDSELNTLMARWHPAAQAFRDLVEDEAAVYERQMLPGECVIFDNRRVLHARTAFKVDDVGKARWLKGAYIDDDPYWSKLRVLEKEFGHPGHRRPSEALQ